LLKVAQIFPARGSSKGGAEVHIEQLASALESIGVTVAKVSPYAEDQLRGAMSLEELVEFDPDLIHTHGGSTSVPLNQFPNTPRVHTFHGTSIGRMLAVREVIKNLYRTIRYRRSGFTAAWGERRLGRSAEQCISVAHATAREISRFFQIPGSKISMIPSAFTQHPAQMMTKSEAKSHLGFQPDTTLILWVGRDKDPMKNSDLFIEAVERLTNGIIEFAMIPGDTVATNPEIRSTGWIEFEELHAYYLAADIYAITSSYEGGRAISLQEAMSFGIPPVVSDIPQLTELVTNGVDAVVFKSRNLDSFLAALEPLITDSELRARIGSAAKDTISGLTWSQVASKTKDVYARALA